MEKKNQQKKLCRVVNLKEEEYDIYIGRPSIWGNPYKVGKHGDRDKCVDDYEVYLRRNIFLFKKLKELKGKVLGCYCKPKRCHGDIIAKIVNQEIKG